MLNQRANTSKILTVLFYHIFILYFFCYPSLSCLHVTAWFSVCVRASKASCLNKLPLVGLIKLSESEYTGGCACLRCAFAFQTQPFHLQIQNNANISTTPFCRRTAELQPTVIQASRSARCLPAKKYDRNSNGAAMW